jgi:multisubunit Na+/H+ antiporter MnhF subunit
MIDTWLLTTVLVSILALGALVRIFRVPLPQDKLVAGITTVTLGSMAALALSITWGSLLLLDITIFLAICCFAITIAVARNAGAGKA